MSSFLEVNVFLAHWVQAYTLFTFCTYLYLYLVSFFLFFVKIGFMPNLHQWFSTLGSSIIMENSHYRGEFSNIFDSWEIYWIVRRKNGKYIGKLGFYWKIGVHICVWTSKLTYKREFGPYIKKRIFDNWTFSLLFSTVEDGTRYWKKRILKWKVFEIVFPRYKLTDWINWHRQRLSWPSLG